MIIKKIIKILLITSSIYILSSCNVVTYNAQIFAMNTIFDITFYEGNQDNLDEVKQHIEYLNMLFDADEEYDNLNNLATLNNSEGKYIEVPVDLFKILKLSVYYNGFTDGYFNILLKEVKDIWLEAFNTQKYPVIDQSLYNLDNNNIELDDCTNSVTFKNGIKADLGAIAKGYTINYIKEYVNKNNIKNYVVNAGSSSILVGNYIQNQHYKVSIKNPNGGFIDKLSLKQTSLSTSGNYLQYLDYNGIRYHHIINPWTLKSENYYQSITVISNDAIYCDVLSTSLFNIELSIHNKYAKNNTKIIYLKTNNEVLINEY